MAGTCIPSNVLPTPFNSEFCLIYKNEIPEDNIGVAIKVSEILPANFGHPINFTGLSYSEEEILEFKENFINVIKSLIFICTIWDIYEMHQIKIFGFKKFNKLFILI